MRLHIVAVGRLRSGPQAILADDYRARAARLGAGLGLAPIEITEIDERKATSPVRASPLILAALGKDEHFWMFDERGENLTSPQFANAIAAERDQGRAKLSFVIGGADGLEPLLYARASRKIAFGSMVWPHLLVRIMVLEQIYRAVSILSALPYHRA